MSSAVSVKARAFRPLHAALPRAMLAVAPAVEHAPDQEGSAMTRQASILRAITLTAAPLLLATSGGIVSADTQLGSRGHTGPHALRDRATLTGATCHYALPAGNLTTITVRPPRVRARDVTAARDHQQVSWSIRVDHWDVNLFWATGSVHGPWAATAWDDQAAAFSARTVDAPTGLGGSYRVVVVLRWLRSGHVEGRSVHRVDWVTQAIGTDRFLDGPLAECYEVLPA